MLPTLIHLIELIRRALGKANRGMSILADAYEEAQEIPPRTAAKVSARRGLNRVEPGPSGG